MIPVIELGTTIWRAVRGALLSSFGIIAAFALVGAALSALGEWGLAAICSGINDKIALLLDNVSGLYFEGDVWAFVFDMFNLDFLIVGVVGFLEIFSSILLLFPTILSASIGVGVSVYGFKAWRQMVDDFFGGK